MERDAKRDSSMEQASILDGLLNIGALLARRRRFVLGATAVAAILVFLGTFLVRPVYRAETTLLPSDQIGGSSSAAVSAVVQLGQSFGMGLDALGEDLSALFGRLLESRRLGLALLGRDFVDADGDTLRLLERLRPGDGGEPRRADRALADLRSGLLSSSLDARSGLTRVAVAMHDPVLAAAVANACVEELDALLREVRTGHAAKQVAFVRGRLAETERDMEAAEESLRDFRDRNRSVAGSPDLRLREQRLVRDVTLKEQLYITLKQQLELERIDEERNVPVIVVVDPAVPPTRKHAPRRLASTATAAVIAFLAALAVAYVRERRQA